MNGIRQYFLLVALLSLFFNKAVAQPPLQEKRIYLVDVTASMEGKGEVETPDIFQTVKESLAETIQQIYDTTTVIEIIPFSNKVYKGIYGKVANKDSLINCVNELTIRKGDTNIADAWSYGLTRLDTTKINYFFVLTDGLHNCGPKKEELYHRLSGWNDLSAGKYMFAFYVMLTPNAKESEICRIADENRNMWKIESLDINASLVKTSLAVRKNVFYDRSVQIYFDSNNPNLNLNKVGIEVSLEDNPYYDIENQRMIGTNGPLSFDIKEKCAKEKIPQCDTLDLTIKHNSEEYPFVFITPDIVSVEITNQGTRTVTMSINGERVDSLLDFGSVRFKEPLVGLFKADIFRKSLRYWPYSLAVPDTAIYTAKVTLSFNGEAVRSNSSIRLNLLDENNKSMSEQEGFGYTSETLSASKDVKEFLLDYKVIPTLGNIKFSGKIIAETTAVDSVGSVAVKTGQDKVGVWRLSQEIEPNVLAWILWIVSILLLLLLAYLLIKLIVKLARFIFGALTSLSNTKNKVRGDFTELSGELRMGNNNKSISEKAKEKSKYKTLPWVGQNYEQGDYSHGKRVLVLGESHYCGSPEEFVPDITINVIKDVLDPDSEHEAYKNTYTKFAKAFSGIFGKLEQSDKVRIWHSLAFYNYVQFPITGPRTAPTEQEFRDSEAAFWNVLVELQPDLIIVWGQRLYKHLPGCGHQAQDVTIGDGKSIETWEYTLSNGHTVRVLPINHPSSGFNPEKWHRVIKLVCR